MSGGIQKIEKPELVFGLVGPIGVNLDQVGNALSDALAEVGYEPKLVHLTAVMSESFPDLQPDNTSYTARYRSLIRNADLLRERADSQAAMAGLAISEIKRIRQRLRPMSGDKEVPALGTAYVLRQFKRAEEISLLREVYGRKFIQISAYLDKEEREDYIVRKIKEFGTEFVSDPDAQKQAIDLIDIDYNEKNEYGQRVSDVFHLGDVFVRGDGAEASRETIFRFVRAFFGDNGISPTKAEYGMYAAAGAALRSIDLSRQVGAAIFSRAGEVVSMGCNEVPKAFGGTYWSDDETDRHRDYEEGRDGNHDRKLRIFHDLVERMAGLGFLSERLVAKGSISDQVQHLLAEKDISDSRMMDIIEFGRIIHAEMSAITDAARLGRSIKDSIMYCTTFPCHLCAKHIISSGVAKLVYLEPYPKSHAKDLYADSITFSVAEANQKVLFEPFIGISPRRYRDIFEKGKRKDGGGRAIRWNSGRPVPQVEDKSSAYLENEEPAISLAVAKLFPKSAVAGK